MRHVWKLAAIWLAIAVTAGTAFCFPPELATQLALSKVNFALICGSLAAVACGGAVSAGSGGDWFSFDGDGCGDSGGDGGGD